MLEFWGKARPNGDSVSFHPLAYHSLDVAAVMHALLEEDVRLRRRLARAAQLDEDTARDLAVLMAAHHDIGKFASRFQAKVPSLYPAAFGRDASTENTSWNHAKGGYELVINGLLPTLRATARRKLRAVLAAATGHHGAPPEERLTTASPAAVAKEIETDFRPAGVEAARAFSSHVFEILRPQIDLSALAPPRAFSFLFAGLVTLADWIGSNENFFPYQTAGRADLAGYFDEARKRANEAIRKVGIIPSEPGPALTLGALLGRDDVIPSPVQEWASAVDVERGPLLAIIEDETGSGKTEAAMLLASRLMASGGADGIFVALPTMATANAMYDRLARSYRRLFSPDANPSLVLSHGVRELHDGFRSAVGLEAQDRNPSTALDADGAGESASAACAAWIADDRRLAFLADVGVGTIDQALLGVLPARHQSLRLAGLARKALIIDEAHAYDSYMQAEIEALLTFQAALGGSAIVLSATLPIETRARLIDAFRRGLDAEIGRNGTLPSLSKAYPLATLASGCEVVETPLEGRADRGRRLPVRLIETHEEAIDLVAEASRRGEASVYIRNTVEDVLRSAEALRARGLDPIVFHARAALGDRLAIEREVCRIFGRDSTEDIRRGRILVATQVVEQSLDIDFDVLVTDLAPIDLVIQRAGRLWRHKRPWRSGHPELVVVAPPPVPEADERWLKSVQPGSAAVYRDDARLWLAAKRLEDAECIVTPGRAEEPGAVRTLVEGVYGAEAERDIPPGLLVCRAGAEGAENAKRSVGQSNVLDPHKGYTREQSCWQRDDRTPTRLREREQVRIRLGRLVDGRVVPWIDDPDPRRGWHLSEVRAPKTRVDGESPDDAVSVQEAKRLWPAFVQNETLLVVLREDAQGWSGTALRNGAPVRLLYHPRQGLRFENG